MKEHIRGLRRVCQVNLTGLLTFVGAAQAAIEFKMIELQQAHRTFLYVNEVVAGRLHEHQVSTDAQRNPARLGGAATAVLAPKRAFDKPTTNGLFHVNSHSQT